MGKRLIATLAGVVAIASIAAGCGGGDTETTASPTKAEFIEQGDAICKKGEEKLEEEADEFATENGIDKNKPTAAQQEEVIEQVVAPALIRQGGELRELPKPSGGEGEVEAILDALEEGAEKMEADPKQLLEGTNPVERASELARQYGFEECGEEG